MDKYITAPIQDEDVKGLKAGDYVYISGTIYTARDAAHKRMYESLQNGENLPIELNNNIIYYLGPTPAREGQVIGSAGPTTSSRMDKYAPSLLDKGLKGMIGKGRRSGEVIDSMKKNTAVTLRQLVEQAHYYPNASKNQKLLHTMTWERKQSAN